eukprot:TRINITY_DN60253_c0_g2_i1.p1 TRINITY_DN60253_c0_g2~~TRINITY_DN60253_c0_g2_i1.p1  ORF type:complete len:163 (-),score=23.62 TRINITY_DN60253_c0_g2_i1:22-510(-)
MLHDRGNDTTIFGTGDSTDREPCGKCGLHMADAGDNNNTGQPTTNNNAQPGDHCVLTEEDFKVIQEEQPEFYMLGPIELSYNPSGFYAQDLAEEHEEDLGELTFLGDLDEQTVSWARDKKGEFFLLGLGYKLSLGHTWEEARERLINRVQAADAGNCPYCHL